MKYNRSIQRCLSLLRQFRTTPVATLNELSEAVELPRATTLRILATLEHEGYAMREDGRWQLTTNMLEIGFAVLESIGMNELIQTHVQGLASQFDGSSNIGERREDEVIIIARALASAERRRLHIANLHVGSVLGQESALFRATKLADGERFAEHFYEAVNQVSVAVPIPNISGRFLSLGISVEKTVFSKEGEKERVVSILIDEAEKVSRIIDSGQI